MSKLVLTLIAMCLSGAETLAHITNDSIVNATIEACFRRQKWADHQFFEVRIRQPAGYVMAYNGIDKKLLGNVDSLRKDARLLFERMVTVMNEEKTNLSGVNLIIYYFDRRAYLIGKSIVFKANIKNGTVIKLEEAAVYNDAERLPSEDRQFLQQLRRLKLSPNQYVLPCLNGDHLEDGISSIDLVNIVPDWEPGVDYPQQEQQLKEILSLIPASKHLEVISIQFRDKFDHGLGTYIPTAVPSLKPPMIEPTDKFPETKWRFR